MSRMMFPGDAFVFCLLATLLLSAPQVRGQEQAGWAALAARVQAALAPGEIWRGAGGEARRAAATAFVATAGAHGINLRTQATDDASLTAALLELATALRHGAAPGDAMGADWGIAAPPPGDIGAELIAAVQADALQTFLETLAPRHPQYAALVEQLRRYRTLVAQGGWGEVGGGTELRLGTGDAREPRLIARLSAEGDLAADHAQEAQAVRAALLRFQSRHGLAADGRIGARTLAALNTSAETRVGQIAANLERWRRLPRALGQRYVAVNAAAATLDLIDDGASAARARVIVGDPEHPTPVMTAKITAVTFNPPWTIPHSIAVKEVLPKLRRDAAYLLKHNMVVLDRGDDPHGLKIDWRAVSPQGFSYQLRQLPGPDNSLGLVKFEMSNAFDVYLHDTPARSLFGRDVRAFSHGCVRVEHPADLAARLLGDRAPPPDLLGAVDGAPATRTIMLEQPVPVYLVYFTAAVGEDRVLTFYPDVYGRDAPLAAALGYSGAAPARGAPPAAGTECVSG